MRALDRKMLRDLRRIWAQTLAIALVLACGIMVMVLANGTSRSLSETRAAYYERHRFADVFASATRAPRGLLPEIAALEGVMQVEARVVFPAILDMPGVAEPVTAKVVSLPATGPAVLNVPLLRGGRLPDPARPEEVLVSEAFARAHGLHPGDSFAATLHGQRRNLRMVGTALSPEFIYMMAPGSMLPDDRLFTLIWMGEAAMAAAADLEGAFNDLALSLRAGASEARVIAGLDRVLAPYGGTGAYGRDRQQSHAFLENELSQLRAMAQWLPPIFMIVAAFLVNMVLTRLITLERAQIGLLKAVGYGTGAIARHYLKLCLLIGGIGVLFGWAVGARFGIWMTELYTEFFRFPFLLFVPDPADFLLSGALGLVTVLTGGLRAVLASSRMPPAVAMSPPAPAAYRRGVADILGEGLQLRQPAMMILRSVTRWPGRAAVTVFGVAASVAVLVASFFFFDVVDVVMTDLFEQANRQQVTLALSQGVESGPAVAAARALPGVIHAEAGHVMPIRLIHGHETKLLSLQAHAEGAVLSRVLDAGGRPVMLPANGLAIPESLAEGMGIALGEVLRIEALAPPREVWDLPVTAIIRQSMGQDLHIAAPALFALMRSTPQANVLHLAVDTGQMRALQQTVKTTPAIAGLIDWKALRAQFDATMAENLLTMTVIYSTLGMLITLGVVYNAARIQLAERAHELASLRVLGFTRREVGFVLVGELMLLSLLALPLGWWLGYSFARLMLQAFSSDIISMPLVIHRQTYGYATVLVLGTALAAALAVRRRLDHVDLVSALKQRE